MKLPAALFEWPSRHNVHIALPLFLVASFLIHAACIIVFQATYPRSRSAPPQSAQVYFLQPGSAEAGAIEPMLAASDPALFSPAQISGRQSWTLPDLTYQPSFDNRRPSLESMPAVGESRDSLQLLALKPASSASATESASPGLPTMVKLSGALAGREMTPPQDIAFVSPPKSLSPVEFLVAVSPDGLPLYIFQQSPSSGYEPLDLAARNYLARTRFSKSGAPDPIWGTAKFLWGADIKREKEQ